MKTSNSLLVASAAISILSASPTALAAPTTPSRVSPSLLGQFPYRTSGVILGDRWRGSGTVARDPNIAVSCAHVVFENGAWLRNYNWAAAHNSSSSPSGSAVKPLRGYWYWTAYTGGNSASAFSQDFVVHYSTSALAGGSSSGWWWNNSPSAHPLAGSGSKMIVGYPGSDYYYQNSVGSFTSKYTSKSGHYLWNSSVKGGSGMSGGGVFARNGTQWLLAGVHVSGSGSGGMGAGVRALDQRSYDLMTKAINSSRITPPTGGTWTFGSTSPLGIPDNSSVWSVRGVPVSGLPTSLTSVKVSVNVTHTYQADLQVMLVSPSGRSITLHDRTGGSADNVIITDQDCSSSFAGTNPNGTWNLYVRDVDSLDVGTLNSISLTLGAR